MMDSSIWFEKKSLSRFIIHFKGLQITISNLRCTSVPEDCFILAISADPDEILHFTAFYLSLHCLLKFSFTVIGVISIQRVDYYSIVIYTPPPTHTCMKEFGIQKKDKNDRQFFLYNT